MNTKSKNLIKSFGVVIICPQESLMFLRSDVIILDFEIP